MSEESCRYGFDKRKVPQNPPRLDLKILMAIDSNIMPKIRLRTSRPVLPSFLSNQSVLFSTTYTIIKLVRMPMAMLNCEYSDFKVRMAVIVPAPAINGKAIGTMEVLAELASASGLKISNTKHLSAPRANMIKASAKAKTSTPNPKRLK